MRVCSVKLDGFRNYDCSHVYLEPGINVISGANAQGKTNLLEAVYMLTSGRSFRTRFDRELIGFDRDSARIDAVVDSEGREQKIEILLRRGLKKKMTLNGSSASAADLSGTLSAVLFCPEDLNLIREGAATRRRLMDMAISQLKPGYGALVSEYSRLYEHKNRILRDFHEKPSLLDTVDEFSDAMCRCSAKMVRYRAAFVRRLEEAAVPVHREFSGENEVLSLRYKTVSTITDPFAPAADIYRQICEHQLSHRQAEIDSQSCLTGCHKDDIEIEINGKSARSFASQGQTRTAALSIKLAEREIHLAERGEYPLLLLDDVLSELDIRRQEFVLNRIGGGQTLITCCEDERIAQRTGGKVITVAGGAVRV